MKEVEGGGKNTALHHKKGMKCINKSKGNSGKNFSYE